MKQGLIAILVIAVAATAGFADTLQVSTIEGGDTPTTITAQYTYAQHITVPTGYTLNKVTWASIYAGTARNQATTQLFNSSNELLATTYTTPWGAWFATTLNGLEIGAGDYYVQLTSSSDPLRTVMGATYYLNSSYTDGYAATGLNGGTPVAGGNADYYVILDYTIPEPATMAMLAVGGGLALIRRRRK